VLTLNNINNFYCKPILGRFKPCGAIVLNNDFDLMNLITLKQKNNNQTNQKNKAKIVVQTNAE